MINPVRYGKIPHKGDALHPYQFWASQGGLEQQNQWLFATHYTNHTYYKSNIYPTGLIKPHFIDFR